VAFVCESLSGCEVNTSKGPVAVLCRWEGNRSSGVTHHSVKQLSSAIPHEQYWCGALLPYLGLEPVGRQTTELCDAWASAMPLIQLPSQSQDITAVQLLPRIIRLHDRDMCLNNLPKVVTWQRNSWESKLTAS